jgi:hypothetical protein
MPPCGRCGYHLTRTHRLLLEKVIYSETYSCAKCGERVRRLRRQIDPAHVFLLSLHTRCVQCGSTRIERLKARDRIDPVSSHPFSQLLRLTGAPVNRCPACRLQYYDWRPLR